MVPCSRLSARTTLPLGDSRWRPSALISCPSAVTSCSPAAGPAAAAGCLGWSRLTCCFTGLGGCLATRVGERLCSSTVSDTGTVGREITGEEETGAGSEVGVSLKLGCGWVVPSLIRLLELSIMLPGPELPSLTVLTLLAVPSCYHGQGVLVLVNVCVLNM